MEKLDVCIAQGDVDPQTVADLLEEASYFVAARSSFAGVMMVIDELGQHLNYAAHQQSDRDLYVLQTLAEMTARSSDVPCLIITILHQAFDRYVGMAGVGQRTEWAKVQGRFVDIPSDPSMQACKQEVVQTLENYENLTGEQKMVVLKGVLDGFLSRVERRNV